MRSTLTVSPRHFVFTAVLASILAAAIAPDARARHSWIETPFALPARTLRSAATADVSGDGKVDVVATTNASLHVFEGLGAGRFRNLGGVVSFVRPEIQGLADVLEDGVPDVIVLDDREDYALAVVSRAPNGTFFVTTSVPLGIDAPTPTTAVGDVDGDGHVDVLVAENLLDTVELLVGRGDGTFEPASPLLSMDAPGTLALADFDADGDLDLIVVSGTVWLPFLNDGGAAFQPLPAVSHPVTSLFTAFEDMNGDGLADLVIVDRPGDPAKKSFVVYLGDGDGRFEVESATEVDVDMLAVVTGDFDGDGRFDAIAAARSGFQTLFANDHGSFDAGPVRSDSSGGVRSQRAADLDGDGTFDYARALEHDVRLHFNEDGLGTFPSVSPLRLPGGESVQEWLVVDLDADCVPDLLTLERGEGAGNGFLLARLGDGNRGFGAGIASTAGARPIALALGDFDEDGRLDAAAGKSVGDSVFVMLGDGAGRFDAFAAIDFGTVCGVVVAGDFDGDGHLDLVLGDDDDSSFGLRLSRGVGNGTFAQPGAILGASLVSHVSPGDFDGDGNLDLLTVPPGQHRVHVWSGDGLGGFALGADTLLEFGPGNPAVADVDADGRDDAILGARVLLRGRGVPLDSSGELLNRFGSSIRATLADFDGDGRLDLVHTAGDSAVIELLQGDGAGRFTAFHQPVVGPGLGSGTLIADFDGDCLFDVAAIGSDSIAVVFGAAPSFLDPRAGNVGAALGSPVNVLFVNGRRGDGACRVVEVDRHELFQIRMKAAPADPDGTCAFMLHAWIGTPTSVTRTTLPFGYGEMCFAPELTGGSPKRTWNNTGDPAFGLADLPSTPAPSLVIRRPSGLGKPGTFFVQGLIQDSGSPSGTYAVTNGILIRSR